MLLVEPGCKVRKSNFGPCTWHTYETIFERGCRTVQELFEKLMKLTRSARDDYRRLALNVVQNASNVSQSCVVQLPVHQQADVDLVTAHTACLSHSSRRRNGFIHSPDKNCLPHPTNGLQENIVEKISSFRSQRSSSNNE